MISVIIESSGKYQFPKAVMSVPRMLRRTGVAATQAVKSSKNVHSGLREVQGVRPTIIKAKVSMNSTSAPFWRPVRVRSSSSAAGNSLRSCSRRKNWTDFSGCALILSA